MLRNSIWQTCLIWSCLAPAVLLAQVPGKYFPLDHRQSPGVAARWSGLTQPARFGQPQPVRVILPESGELTFFQGGAAHAVVAPAPAQVTMFVGHVYRVKIAKLPGLPGVELYPTIELIDRLHPPAELRDQFPIPVEITAEEIAAALADRLVTKVIYLEQPDFAVPLQSQGSTPAVDLPEADNLLAAADHRGRPLAILRLGSRVPDPRSPVDEFYSQSPILFTGLPQAAPTARQLPVMFQAR